MSTVPDCRELWPARGITPAAAPRPRRAAPPSWGGVTGRLLAGRCHGHYLVAAAGLQCFLVFFVGSLLLFTFFNKSVKMWSNF